MAESRVFLIGGAPGVGKTTLGRSLAAKIGITSLSTDDILTAAKAVTTPASHPGLHVMSAVPSAEYFTNRTLDQLEEDATAQHEATWPAIEKVIRSHATWGPSIVIEGWALSPARVRQLGLRNVKSLWLVADPKGFAERERKNAEFFRPSSDPERMFLNFVGRSRWHNEFTEEQASVHGFDILRPDGLTPEEACSQAAAILLGSPSDPFG